MDRARGTALARCISGYLRPTRGTLRVADTEVWRLRPAQRATRVGYVFQNPDHQLFRERVWDDVAFGLQNLGASPDQIQESVEQVLGGSSCGTSASSTPSSSPGAIASGSRSRPSS